MKGWIELCTQTMMSGWTTAPSVKIYVNGEEIGVVESGSSRPDLIAAGFDLGKTFNFRFPSPLWLNDRVSIRLPDDSLLFPAEEVSHVYRLKQILSHLDLKKPGLEFGPLSRPLIPRKQAKVYYVDHDDQAGLKRSYAKSLPNEIESIPTIDFVWSNGSHLADVVKNQRFAWAVASHVGEHVADFIGWLNEISGVLENGGYISLALPNREKTFDARRQLTNFEDLVAANIMKLDRPSPHQVLRHMFGVGEYWGKDYTRPENFSELQNAVNIAKAAFEGAYIDIHCSVFTPESFVDCFSLVEKCGLCQLKLDSVSNSMRDEFFVRLVKK